jgi:predicted SAM-dependent methyltransferase
MKDLMVCPCCLKEECVCEGCAGSIKNPAVARVMMNGHAPQLQHQVRIYIGSGYARIPGFQRFDIDPAVQPDVLGDAAKLTEHVGEAAVDEIRAHHILEHFFIAQAFPVLREWWKALKPCGRLEIAVPDCGYAARAYAMGNLGHNEFVKILAGGDQQATAWMVHKNFFTVERLERLLFITGFVGVKDIRAKADELKYEAYRPKEGK